MIVFDAFDLAGFVILALMFLICLEVAIITKIISRKGEHNDND